MGAGDSDITVVWSDIFGIWISSGIVCVPLYPCSYSLGGPCHAWAGPGPDRLDLFQSAANGLGVPTLASSPPLGVPTLARTC